MAVKEDLPKEEHGRPSLPEAFKTVRVNTSQNWLKSFFVFAGPGYLVSVGYMDPGNWATDLAGGSGYGYRLLWVIALSNLMAMLLQTLCARLGLVTGRDLAQSCRDHYKAPAAVALWIFAEIGIIACDFAEVIGSAVALKLLFGLPLVAGVVITGFDVLLLLGLMRFGFRKLEAAVVTLVAVIFVSFGVNIVLSHPNWGSVAHGLVVPNLPDRDALLIAVGIVGATVMPHNLYLHSSLVQTRDHGTEHQQVKRAIRFNTADTLVALSLAFLVNAAILIVSAAVFHSSGSKVEELEQAHSLLRPVLGSFAATAFAIALLASGQSSTITGTLAGQVVMEGFLHMRVKPWLRRVVTRLLAIIPAVVLIGVFGDKNTNNMIVLSQVVLSLQLVFALFPLLQFTSSRSIMKEFVSPAWLKVAGYATGILIAVFNGFLLIAQFGILWPSLFAAACLSFAAWVHFLYKGKTAAETRIAA